MPKFEWTRKTTKQLISLLRGLPELWDVSDVNYKNRGRRMKAVAYISQVICVEPEEVNRKIHNLRTQFKNEVKNSKKRKKLVDPDNDDGEYVGKWEFFEALQFIQQNQNGRHNKTLIENNLEISDIDDDFQDDEKNLATPVDDPLKINLSTDKIIKDEDNLERALIIMNNEKKSDDDANIFGNFVASALRDFHSDKYRRKLQRKIQETILEFQELDEELRN